MSLPSPTASPAAPPLRLSVVICCYTADRIEQVRAAIDSTVPQLNDIDELIVVVDHNDDLHAALHSSVVGARIVRSTEDRGLSGARNTGVATATGDVVVFLDDDATLDDDALRSVRSRFADPQIVGIGGAVTPAWQGGRSPDWFPSEFGWVVGCDYRGLPDDGAEIRNPIGAAMAVRREALDTIGGFSPHLGRRGTFPAGCEETLMGIALRQSFPDTSIVRDTSFRVSHHVSDERTSVRYYLHRCFQEGRSKAMLAALTSTGSALSSEKSYAAKILTSGVWRHRRAPARALALIFGFVFTTAGFVTGTVTNRLAAHREDRPQ
ncbi:glycosyltransferase [Gordonia sp. CPCC 205515]|uniref:glycosyltransferase family 2 protein n=1 Tax=Gordonia sp. CPCC 205515 TaxID=3140791 RepID=UPI003AF3BF0F